jgi:DNA processing protein
MTIVSGLAFGVDAMAHTSALAVKGKTVAVLASGLNDITPRSNTRLGERILESGGTLISEYPIGTPPLRQFFIERNRIVSGLSLGILVIEAPGRSGTLSTARFALDQNREVLVVPGPITNQNFVGSHALIRAGATLVTSPAEVLSALHILPEETHTQPLPFLDGTEQRIVELLSIEQKPLTVDSIAERLSLGTAVINEAVALLTIEGIIKEGADSYYL